MESLGEGLFFKKFLISSVAYTSDSVKLDEPIS